MEAPESWCVTGRSCPRPDPALLQAVGSTAGSLSMHNHLQWSRSSGCLGIQGMPSSGCHSCMATLGAQVRPAQPEEEIIFASQTHLARGQVLVHRQTGPPPALAGDQPARTEVRWQSSPAAQRATGQQPPSPSSLSVAELGASALPASLPCPTSGCQCHHQGCAGAAGGSPMPLLAPWHQGALIPPAQVPSTVPTALAAQHSQRGWD